MRGGPALSRVFDGEDNLLYAGPCSRLHTQANTRGDTRVVGYAVGY